jgi:uncharacterized protein (TIGR02452 family)
MAAIIGDRPVVPDQMRVTQPSRLDALREKVVKYILNRWALVVVSALAAAACFGIFAGLVVGAVGAIIAAVVKKAAPVAPPPTPAVQVPVPVVAQPPAPIVPVPVAPAQVVPVPQNLNVRIFERTLEAIQNGQHIDAALHQQMLGTTRVVQPYGAPLPLPVYRLEPLVFIAPFTTYEMTRRVVQLRRKTLVLDMANAQTPGGAVLRGARGQEEDLCRQTNLYPALTSQPYPIPEHGGILVPNVQFLRNDAYEFAVPFTADVFASAAYDCNLEHGGDRPANQDDYIEGTKEKMRTMFRVGREIGSRALVLSAFGCGAFRNDPVLISRLYREVLDEPEFNGAFDVVAYGIYDPGREMGRNYRIFRLANGLD